MDKSESIPLAEPDLRGNEAHYLQQCIETGWISSIGPFVNDFEQRLANYVGVPHALTTSNGTVALHLALAALRIGPGDEVIVPDLTFAATANAVIYCGATPVLVDVRPDDWNLDPVAVRAAISPRTKAIPPVHLYGHPCRMDEILAIAQEAGLYVVEDAAESLGSRWREHPSGSQGDIACFSFYGNWMFNILLPEGTLRQDLMQQLEQRGIATRTLFYPLHQMPPYQRYVRPGQSFPVSDRLSARGLSLPSATTLRDDQIARVCATLRDLLGESAWATTKSEPITTS